MYMYNDGNPLQLFRAYTLVDITKTNVVRDHPGVDPQARNQHRNWETFQQVLGLRSQITFYGSPDILIVNGARFHERYEGQHRVWTAKFSVEYEDVFSDSMTEFGTLEKDFSNVPIITGLTESADLPVPMFDTTTFRNIYFEAIKL